MLDALPGKTVWVRTLDAPTDDSRNMQGGESEPHEHNPILGWRGIRRDNQSFDQFRLQVEAFKRLWKSGLRALGVMFPMVSHPDRFIKAKEMMRGWGVDVENVTLGMIIEIHGKRHYNRGLPKKRNRVCLLSDQAAANTVHNRHERNNENVADMYNPQHPAVLSLIHNAIQESRAYGVECSICGQAGSDPKMANWLVEHGIDQHLCEELWIPIAKIRKAVAKT